VNPAPFTYHKVGSLDEAIRLLGAHGADAKLLAGGHSLLPIMKLRLVEPEHLVDIDGVSELRGIELVGDRLRIGALTTHGQVERDPLVRRLAPLLAETAGQVGDRQVRNRGTIGGALAHADAAADYPAAILVLDATIVARGPAGERRIPSGDFFVDLLTTSLSPDEIVTAVEVPALPCSLGWQLPETGEPGLRLRSRRRCGGGDAGRSRSLPRGPRRHHRSGRLREASSGDGGPAPWHHAG
jgi:carbon-monoxide dehydrogenase medium subunit